MPRAVPCLLGATLVFSARVTGQTSTPDYRVVVVSESADIATWLRPAAAGLVTDRVVPIGVMRSDIDGPHNVPVAPDGSSYGGCTSLATPATRFKCGMRRPSG
jgi:hypothetical protein